MREERKPGEVSLVVPELTGIMRSGPSDRILTMVISTAMQKLYNDLVNLMLDAKPNVGC